MTLKINLSLLKKKIEHYVKEYYSLEKKPLLEEVPKEMEWIRGLIGQHVDYTIINLELMDLKRVDVAERLVDWDDSGVKLTCVSKNGYEIEKKMSDQYTSKFMLKGGKVAKVTRIWMWLYKQRNEMKSVINNEFRICKKAESLGIGPKTLDSFICFNKEAGTAYKVVVSEYIKGVSLAEWLIGNPSNTERDRIHGLVKKKIDKMHENGIIHSNLHPKNVILKQGVGGKIIDIYITDFVNSYDVQDKKMWDYNKWIQGDRYVLNKIYNKDIYAYDNSDDVVNYVASKMRNHVKII